MVTVCHLCENQSDADGKYYDVRMGLRALGFLTLTSAGLAFTFLFFMLKCRKFIELTLNKSGCCILPA